MSWGRQAIALLLLLALPLSAVAAGPDPHHVGFAGEVTYHGNGCVDRSVGAAFSEDRTVLSLFFDAFDVAVGPDTPPQARKMCDVRIPLTMPAGWRYTLVNVGFDGHIYLDRGVVAHIDTGHAFQQPNHDAPQTHVWEGPRDEFLQIDQRMALAPRGASPCGGPHMLHIRSVLGVNNARNRQGYGQVSHDTTEAAIAQAFALAWEPCR